MQSFFRKLLNVQPGEGRKLAVLYLLVIVIGTGLVWGASISRALFLKRVGVEWLPLMFILSALLAFPVGVLYTAFVDRVKNTRLLTAMFAIVAGVLLACWGLLFLEDRGVTIPYVESVYSILYLVERVQASLFSVHAWTLFNDYYDIRAAKRAFPLLGSASRVAGILSAPIVAAIALFPLIQGQDLVLAWVAIMGVGVWMSSRLSRWLAAERQQAASGSAPETSASFMTYWHNLRGGFRFVSASTFLKLLAVGAFAMTALLALIDYQASIVVERSFPGDKELVIFYSVFQCASNAIALPIQMILLSRLVSRIGVGKTNLIYPIGNLLSYAALSVWPSLGTAMAGLFSRDAFRAAVNAPVENMLYNAVPVAIKGRARAFVRGLLLPLAEIAIGLILLWIGGTGSLPWWLIGIGGVAALTHLIMAILVRRRYTQALVAMLEEEDFSAYRAAMMAPTGSELGLPDPATFQRLLERLRTSEDEDLALFLAQIVAEVGGRDAASSLVAVAQDATPQVQAGILEALLDAGTVDETALALSRQSLAASEPRLRRAALAVLERLLGAGNPELLALAAPLLDDPDPETRLPAILLLVNCGDFFYLADAVRSLNELLSAEASPAHRIAGLRVLQAMDDARMVRDLRDYVADPDDQVRLQSALAIENLADPQAPGWAISLARQAATHELTDPVEGVRLSALRTLGKVGGETALDLLMAALADPSDLVREQAGLGLLAMGQEAVSALEAVLEDESTSEQTQQAAAITLGRMARAGIVSSDGAQQYARRVEEQFEETLRRIYADVLSILALADLAPVAAKRSRARRGLSGLETLLPADGRATERISALDDAAPGPVSDLLRDGLRQRNERRLEGVFHLLAAVRQEPPATIGVIARTLQDSSAGSQTRANALEALESLTSPRLARLVGQVSRANGAGTDELIATGRREWGLEPVSPVQALEIVLDGQDRWLAAIGVVLVGETKPWDAAALRDTWLPQWLADPDPAVREAALYTARQFDMEKEMEDTIQASSPQSLSEVEQAIFLKQVPLFDSMTVEQLRTLASIAEEQYYEEGQMIFAEGDPGEALYVVVSGRVSIEREPRRGRVQRLEMLTPRQYFGERSIFDGAAHENRAVAVDAAHLLTIRREPLLTLIRRSPDLSLALVTVLSQRLREADAKLAAKTRPKPDQVLRLYDKLTVDDE